MRSVLACGLVLALAQLGCDPPPSPPGDQYLGSWGFHAHRPLLEDAGLDVTLVPGTCKLEPETGLDNAYRDFDFEGTFSRCTGNVESAYCPPGSAGRAYFTAPGMVRDAGSNAQYAWLDPMTEDREFSACVVSDGGTHVSDGGPCATVTETMTVALFSVSQALAVGSPFRCPPRALDGGVPVPDGGVVAPDFTQPRFDAVFACGELREVVRVHPECSCVRNGKIPGGECVIYYDLFGVRQ